VEAHGEEDHDEKEELHVSSDNEFADMFETPPLTSSSKVVGTSS